jgi:hypothetical protein
MAVCYFVLLLTHVLASMSHLLGGYLQGNTFKTNAVKDVHIWSSDTLLSVKMLVAMCKCSLITGILHFLLTVC